MSMGDRKAFCRVKESGMAPGMVFIETILLAPLLEVVHVSSNVAAWFTVPLSTGRNCLVPFKFFKVLPDGPLVKLVVVVSDLLTANERLGGGRGGFGFLGKEFAVGFSGISSSSSNLCDL